MIEYQMVDAALPLDILSSCSKKLVSICEAYGLPKFTGLTDKAIDINFHHIGETLGNWLLHILLSGSKKNHEEYGRLISYRFRRIDSRLQSRAYDYM